MTRRKQPSRDPGAPPPALVCIVGDDAARRDDAIAELRKRLGPDGDHVRRERHPGVRLAEDRARLVAELSSPPLFGGRMLVEVPDGDEWFSGGAAWAEVLFDLPDGVHVVFFLSRLDGRTRFARRLKESGGLIECKVPAARPEEIEGEVSGPLVARVREEAERVGVVLDERGARELVGRTGGDPMNVRSELEKIAVHLGGKGRAGVETVCALVPRRAAWDRFRLFEEIARGDAAAALRRVQGMLHEGAAERSGKRTTDPRSIGASIVALLARRLERLDVLRALVRQGASREEKARVLDLRNPGQLFYLEKEVELPIARRAGQALRFLLEADRALKTSQPADVVLARLVVRLAGLARGASAQGRDL